MGVIDLHERAPTEWLHDCFRHRRKRLDAELADFEGRIDEISDDELITWSRDLKARYEQVVQPGYFRDARSKLREILQPDLARYVIEHLTSTDARWRKFRQLYELGTQQRA